MPRSEKRTVVWRHPKGIYAVVEVSGIGVFGRPYSYRETVHTPQQDTRGVALKPEPAQDGRHAVPRQGPPTEAEEREIVRLYTQECLPLAALTYKTHRTGSTIRAILHKYGVETHRGRRKRA